MTKTERLKNAILRRIAVHERDRTLPTTNRFLFYELEGKNDGYGILVSKVQTGKRRADQDMIDALTALREDGLVPWDYIIDETRHVESISRAKTIAKDFEEYLPQTKIDAWQFGNVRPYVICESRSLAGVLRDLCWRYGVNSTSTNGQNNGFLRTKLADSFNRQNLKTQVILVLYCGDLDIGGGQIEQNTRKVLEDTTVADFRWERLMLTKTQVSRYKLPSILKHDRRYKNGGQHEAWECEALSQKLIVKLLSNRLKALLRPQTISEIEKVEQQQRSLIRVTKKRK